MYTYVGTTEHNSPSQEVVPYINCDENVHASFLFELLIGPLG